MNTERHNTLIVPDVHGRTFWKAAKQDLEEGRAEKVIFLGDYLDPYPYEGIVPEQGLIALFEIIAFKKEYPQQVVLLLGNHDLGYLDSHICLCRHDYMNGDVIKQCLKTNLPLFDMVHIEEREPLPVLYSHAGIRQKWVEFSKWSSPFQPESLNAMLHNANQRKELFQALRQVHFMRGGKDDAGSVVWADADEWLQYNDGIAGFRQIFGHSQCDVPMQINPNTWCVDCHRIIKTTEIIKA